MSSPRGRISRVPPNPSLRLRSCIPLSESREDVIKAGSAMTKLERQSEMTKPYRSILVVRRNRSVRNGPQLTQPACTPWRMRSLDISGHIKIAFCIHFLSRPSRSHRGQDGCGHRAARGRRVIRAPDCSLMPHCRSFSFLSPNRDSSSIHNMHGHRMKHFSDRSSLALSRDASHALTHLHAQRCLGPYSRQTLQC